jgi:serine/threonine-protein phosphatase PGAM5
MTRATETAQLIAEELPGVPTERCDLCREGAPIVAIPSVPGWIPSEHDLWKEGARIEACFRRYFWRCGRWQKP